MKLKAFGAFRFAMFIWLVCVLGYFGGHNYVLGQSTAPDVGLRFQPPKSVLLTNATIVVAPGRKLENADLLIRDGKIAKVGVDLQSSSDVETIECDGKFLYSAIVDAFVEFPTAADVSPAASWNNNVQPQRLIAEQLKPEANKLDALRKAGIGVVLAVPDNGIIKGQSCVISTATKPLESTLLRRTAFQHIRLLPERGGGRGSYPSSPMGAVALVRQTFLDANWYQQAQLAYQSNPSLVPPDFNTSLESLEPTIRGRQTAIIDGPNDLYALRADRIAKEFSLKLVVRGSGREYRQLNAIAATRRTFIIPVDFPKAPEVATRTAALDASLQSLMHWHFAPENPGRIEKAGVEFVITSDALESPSDLIPNVVKAIRRGLTEDAALAALTTRPAKLLEVDQIAGTLEVGKLANILVTDGPLFGKETKLLETWVVGERSNWADEEKADLSGKWSIALSRTDAPQALEMQLTGTGKKMKGELGLVGAFEAKKEKETDQPAANEKEKVNEKAPQEEIKKEEKGEAKPENKKEDTKPTDEQKAEKEKAEKLAKSKTELKQLKFDGYRLTASFRAESLVPTNEGVGFLSASIESTLQVRHFSGTIQWPDGTSNRFEATLPAKNESEVEDKDSDAKKKSKDSGDDKTESLEIALNFPLGAYGSTALPQQPNSLLLRGATVWTCGPNGILEVGDVLVQQGKIAAVGKSIDAPEGCVILDVTGMHITPGIIDCHSHMATDGGVNEGSQAVTSEVRIADFIDPTDITIYRQLAGGVTTANILHGSANPIGGQNQVIKLRWGAPDDLMIMAEAPSGIKFALGENVKRSSAPESETARYPYSRMGVEQIMRDRFEAAKLYRHKQRQYATNPTGIPPRRDLELDAIAEVLEHNRWVHCHSYRQDEILTFLRLLEDYGVTVGSLQHILEGYKVADAMAKHGATGSSFSDWWAYKMEVFDAIPFNGALMHKAGVIVSFNSDDDELARHLNHEAAKAVKYGGVKPEEALKFVTLNPAKQLRIDSYVGSLEVDKQADLVVWNGPPLSTLSVCMQTWIDGRKYFDRKEDLTRRLEDGKLQRQLVQSILNAGHKTTSKSQDDKDPSTWWARYDEFCNHGHHHHDEEE
jgi:imidazolonepropionase-like amidohydrolase